MSSSDASEVTGRPSGWRELAHLLATLVLLAVLVALFARPASVERALPGDDTPHVAQPAADEP
jgi:hypothetical protein